MKKIFCLVATVSFYLNIIYAQKTQTFSTQINDSWIISTGGVFKARDQITLKSGFNHSATTRPDIAFVLDPNIICNVEYQSSQIDPDDYELDTKLEVGSMQGNYNVLPTGALTYTIPIDIPSGTAGIQPNLALVYNSQVGNGLLGYGWNLSGLSAITRVGTNIYNDGYVDEVDFDGNDRFALDGQRLINTTGEYMQDNTVYHVENNPFTEITQHGSYIENYNFEVNTKDGKTLYYGTSANSRMLTDVYSRTNQIYEKQGWFLDKVKDNLGNSYTVTYYNDSDNEEYYPLEIAYTENTDKGLEAFCKIKFYYEERTDKQKYYVYNSILNQNKLLYKIEVIQNGKLYKRYILKYKYDSYSFLTEVEMYGSAGKKINSSYFTWNKSTSNNSFTKTFTNPEYKFQTYPADFDGDGMTDFLMITAPDKNSDYNKWRLYITEKSGSQLTYSKVDEGSLPGRFEQVVLTDQNRDGKADVYFKTYVKISNQYCYNDQGESCDPNGGGGGSGGVDIEPFIDNPDDVFDENCTCYTISYWEMQLRNYYFNGTSLVRNSSKDYSIRSGSEGASEDSRPVLSGDFNGDGQDDQLIIDTDGNYKGMKGFYFSSPLPDFGSPDQIYISDINGNGINEMAAIKGNTLNFYEYNWHRNNISKIRGVVNDINREWFYSGDFNGDGKTDILNWDNTDGWKLYYSTGKDCVFAEGTAPGLYGVYPEEKSGIRIYIIDMNNDGKDDILQSYIHVETNGNINNVYYAVDIHYGKGNGFNSKTAYVDGSHVITYYEKDNLILGDFDGNGSKDLIFFNDTDESVASTTTDLTNYENTNRLMHEVVSGYNNVLTFNFKTLADPSVHTRGSGATFPLIDIQTPLMVLAEIGYKDANNTSERINYSYQGARTHVQGKGFLGFSKITQTNSINNSIVENYYEFDPDFYSLLPVKTIKKIGSNSISEITYTNDKHLYFDDKCYFLYASQVKNQNYIKGNTIIKDNTFDTDGNLTETISHAGKDSKSIITTYTTRNGSTVNSLPKTVTHKNMLDNSLVSKVTYYDYYDNDLLKEKIKYYGSADKELSTKYVYDNFGNVTSATQSVVGEESRTDTYVYDETKRFVEKRYDVYNNLTEISYDEFGNIIKIVDPNGLVTTYRYDEFNRKIQETLPNGLKTVYDLKWDDGSGPNGTLYYTTESKSGTPKLIKYYNKKGKLLRSEIEGLGGSKIWTDYMYNDEGQLRRESLPYKPGESCIWNNTGYDAYGRIDYVLGPNKNFSVSYNNNTVTTTDNHINATYTKTYNAFDLLTASSDPGGTIYYKYNGHGLVGRITYPDGNVHIQYDGQGNKISMNDPDVGQMDYTYNGFGELLTQTDARGNTFTMSYDKLGRLLTKDCNDGTSITNVYDTKMVGLISEESHSNGIKYEYTYNEYGRLIKSTETIPDNSGDNIDYSFSYEFDNLNRMTDVIYPSGFHIKKSYDNFGYLTEIYNVNDSEYIWEANSMNAFGEMEDYNLGNGLNIVNTYKYGQITSTSAGSIFQEAYSHYSNGNLKTVTYNQEKPVTFEYDNLNRLTKLKQDKVSDKIYDFESNGNITNRADVGELHYGGTTGASAHAVTSVVNNEFISINTQTVNFNSFNSISDITENSHKLDFTYGPGEARKKVKYYHNSSLIETKYYVGLYEKEVQSNNKRELNYITSPDGIIAVYIIDNSGNGKMHYIHKDRLGSYRAISDNLGNLEEEYRYGPWGHRCSDKYDLQAHQDLGYIINRGFTGHEHMDVFGLINMNGRVYDPVLGRFLHPDNNIQLPNFTQNYNRYSYALNNPLMFTDPDGESAIAVAAIIGAFVNIVINEMQGNINNGWDYVTYGLIGAASGAAGGAVGGALSGVASGFAGGAISGAAGGAAGGFISGTGNSWVSGAGFEDGLMAGLESAGMGALAGGVVGGLAGGISAYRNGGDFWTGKGAVYDEIATNVTGDQIEIGEGMEYSNKYVREFSDDYYGKDVKGVQEIYADGSIPEGYSIKGDQVLNKDNLTVRASSVDLGNGKVKVLFYKASFTSKEQLYLTMGHEYLHAAYTNAGLFNSNSEHASIYKWQAYQAKLWNYKSGYYAKMYNQYKPYYNSQFEYSKFGFFLLNVKPW